MSSQAKRVLIVDDERSIRYVLSKQFEALGYQCVAVASGQEALSRLAQQGFDLVLLDVRMPGMSGLDVLRQLRAEHPQTCVVMLSALVDTDLAAQAIRLGADDYVTKPYSLEELNARIQRALERKEPLYQGGPMGSPHELEFRRAIESGQVTKDLISQQMHAFERRIEPADKAKPKPRRRWWPWGRR